jgi:ethanolamine kinase
LPNDTDELKRRNHLFRAELKWLLDLVGNTPGLDGKDLVVSHTDLLCGNVIIEEAKTTGEEERSVSIIDFEYVTAAPAAFDIANWFGEWMGPELEHSWIPSQSQRLDFIEHYVQSFRKHSDSNSKKAGELSTEKVVQQLYDQVQLFRGLPGFYW